MSKYVLYINRFFFKAESSSLVFIKTSSIKNYLVLNYSFIKILISQNFDQKYLFLVNFN
jgi:hypothetical protein